MVMKNYKQFLNEADKPLIGNQDELINKLKELMDQMKKMNDDIRNTPWQYQKPQRQVNKNEDFCYRFAVPYYISIQNVNDDNQMQYDDLFIDEVNDNVLVDSVKDNLENSDFYELSDYYGGECNNEMLSSEVVDFDDFYSKFIIKCCFNRALTNNDIQCVIDYISGQCSDGIGEGFEQQEFEHNNREYYISTWWHGVKNGRQYRIECLDCDRNEPEDENQFEDDFED